MKVFELFESDEWENTAFENKKAEMEALQKKRKAIEHQRWSLEDKIVQMLGTGSVITKDVWRGLPDNKDYVPVKGPGGNVGFTGSYKYFVDKRSPQKSLIDKIEQQYVRLERIAIAIHERIKDLTVRGYSFCFTGFRDEEAERKIKALGGAVHTSAVSGLNYLVAKDPHSGSGKLLKAKREGAKIISKQQLDDMLRD